MLAFVDRYRDVYGVEPIRALLSIAPSSYYAHKARQGDLTRRPAHEQRDEALAAAIRERNSQRTLTKANPWAWRARVVISVVR